MHKEKTKRLSRNWTPHHARTRIPAKKPNLAVTKKIKREITTRTLEMQNPILPLKSTQL
jgi:hypothetical protein